MSNADPLEEAQANLAEFQKSITAVAKTGIQAAKDLALASFKAASNFEGAMSSIQMATGQTNQQMEATKDVAKHLYSQNFGSDWKDLGATIVETSQLTGLQGKALEETTKKALLLKDAYGIGVKDSIQTASSLVDQFGISSDQAMSLLAQGKEKGLDISGDMLNSTSKYSESFKKLGFNANQMFNTMAAGGLRGKVSMDKIGSAVKEFGTLSKGGSAGAKKAFQTLGLDAAKMTSTFKAGGPEAQKAFTNVMKLIGNIKDPLTRNAVGVSLMGNSFQDLELKAVKAMGSAQNQFDMTKDKMTALNQTKINSPAEALSSISRQVETGLLIPLGEKMLPYLIQFADWMRSITPEIQSVGSALGEGLGSALSIIGESISFLFTHLDLVVSMIIGLGSSILIYMIPAITAWIVATWPAIAAGFATVAAWLPIIGLGLLIGAAIYGLVKVIQNWGAISDWLVVKWNACWLWITNLFNSMLQFFVTWGTFLLPYITAPIITVVDSVTGFWNSMYEATKRIWESIANSVKVAGSTFLGYITDVATTIANTYSNLWLGISLGVSGMWDNIKGFFVSGVNWVINKLNDMITKLNEAMNVELPGVGKIGVTIPSIPTIPTKSDKPTAKPNVKPFVTRPIFVPPHSNRAVDGSYAKGLDYVPFNGFIAELHQGERVLTAEENKTYSASSPESAPVRRWGSTNANKMEVNLKVDVQGSSMNQAQNADFLLQMKQLMQSVFEETIRRGGMEGTAS
ncbi:phage-related minor tail protein [Paenibacillus shirakamiensis]|uniref:Phage-related minor tail protein n=1 Tax=Paenibacillus shirakamiensis TaxID=1265935 RepID=A0ABS4JLI0_9BACL|nr:phage tail tape measure protein [Paenibacillus shirakamiensis]MBP2002568.1 phage-related minor tail protein [Paenibacillus shirakamiensis]